MSSVEGFETVQITSPGGALTASFVPAANLVCHSLARDGAELLHAGRGVRVYAEHGKTMGIPLLYPWANRLAGETYRAAGKVVELPPAEGRYELDPNGLPRHGALPELMRWEVQERDRDGLRARLPWTDPELHELFPFTHVVEVEARLTDTDLRIATTIRATGEDGVPVAFGYHPYLRVPDVPRADYQVELGASERAILDPLMIPTGDTEPLAERRFRLAEESWDDALAGLDEPTPRFAVAGGGHTLAVTFEAGYHAAQVYAPPGQDFICFEPMTAPTNALVDGRGLTVVAPGDEYRAAFRVTIADT